MFREILTDIIIVAGIVMIAAGRIPGLRMNRAAIALATAAALLAIGAISLPDAYAAIDMGTIVLLLSMMIIVAGVRMSGAFDLVAYRMAGLANNPRLFLAGIIAVSGVLSALFLNDTMCLVLGPVVAETSLKARRNPVPYLIATATAANVGSAATIIGNPQNMLIGAISGISFVEFLARIGPSAFMGLLICWAVTVLVFPGEFLASARRRRLASAMVSATSGAGGQGVPGAVAFDKSLLAKSAIASAVMLAGFMAGVPVVIAALVPAAFLLVSRRVESSRMFAGVDFNLLVFFGGLFVITATVTRTAAFSWLETRLMAGTVASPWIFSASTTIISNLISNVPAVMVLSPVVLASTDALASSDAKNGWFLLAMASTFAGNLSLLGSVANLIVAEGAARCGVRLDFRSYLRAGFPITLATLAVGTILLG
jgi:Na+/H+ antiporter NhaD/arsenite permease-like protein